MSDIGKLENDASIMCQIEELFDSLNDYYGESEDKFSDAMGGLTMLINHKLKLLRKRLKNA